MRDPGSPDGAILCNCEAMMFKINFQQNGAFESIEYGFSHMPDWILEPVYAGFRWFRCDLPMKSAAASNMTTG
jgi:hypothetical protein